VERTKWVALVVVVLYIAADVLILAPHYRGEGHPEARFFPGQHAGSFLAFLAFAAIWWPEMIGAAFLHARFSPLPDSWTFVVRILGWAVLALAVKMRFDFAFG